MKTKKENKKIKVFLRISANADCGVGYYRQWLPLMVLERKGLIELHCKHFTFGESQDPEFNKSIAVSEQEMMEELAWCDIAYFSRNDTPDYIAYMAMASDYFKKPVMMDYDDLVWHTRPVNPGYRSFHPNSEYNSWNLEALKYITGLTVSTDFIGDWYKDKMKANGLKIPVYLLPNSIDMQERDKLQTIDLSDSSLYQKKPGEFRIIWSGSASHYENLQVALPAIKRIMRERPNVTFYMTGLFGGLFDDVGDDIKNRVATVRFVDLREYGKILKEMHGDIAIAPLTDCNFNRAKSNLRLLEYGSVKSTVVASAVLPYNIFKQDEAAIIGPEDWYDTLNELIDNPKKREDMADKLYDRVKKDFDVEKTAMLWYKAFKDQIKKTK